MDVPRGHTVHAINESGSVTLMEPKAAAGTTGQADTNMDPSKGIAEFQCFPRLPPELRAMIWNESIPHIWAYQFEFKWTWYPGTEDIVALFKPSPCIKQDTQPHRTLLKICSESRGKVLASFNLLPLYTDVLLGHDDEEDFYDTGNERRFETVTVPFDREFGIFCITLPIRPEDFRVHEATFKRFTNIISGFEPASQLNFHEWCYGFFEFSHGFHFCSLVRNVAFVVTMPKPDGRYDDDDFEVFYTNSHFTLFCWGLITRFKHLDNVYFTHSVATALDSRLNPEFHYELWPITIPNVCKCYNSNSWGRADLDTNLLEEMKNFSFFRKRCILELEACYLGLDEEDIWDDENDCLMTLEELRANVVGPSTSDADGQSVSLADDDERSEIICSERSNDEEQSEEYSCPWSSDSSSSFEGSSSQT